MPSIAQLVDAWEHSADDVLALTADLTEVDARRPTDLEGWDVADVLAHLVHLEGELADGTAAAPGTSGSTVVGPDHTEAGVQALRGRPIGELRQQFADVVATRRAQLADLPDDPAAEPPGTPGGVAWSLGTLLQNRVMDLWVHEQDLRRALRQPSKLDAPGAVVVVAVFAGALGYVIGKRLKPAPGTVVLLEVSGPIAFSQRLVVDGRGRAGPAPDGAKPTVTVSTDTETFAMLCAGRQDPGLLDITVTGNRDLGARLLKALAVTP